MPRQTITTRHRKTDERGKIRIDCLQDADALNFEKDSVRNVKIHQEHVCLKLKSNVKSRKRVPAKERNILLKK